MRRFLDTLYLVSGGLAALFMVGVLAAVVTSIVSRQMGVYIPGLDAYAGYSMAGAGFLALAHTFRCGEHIRVSLVLAALPPAGRHRLDIFALLVACLASGNLSWYSLSLVLDSYAYMDISVGNDATPLWIPQITMAVGTFIFFIAVLDETIARLRGTPEAQRDSESYSE